MTQYQYLQFSDIRESEVLFGQQHDMNANASMTGLLQYKYALSPPFFTLDQAISSMENSQQWTYRILTLADRNDGASVLLCVKQGKYYIFDSHSRDTFGNVSCKWYISFTTYEDTQCFDEIYQNYRISVSCNSV